MMTYCLEDSDDTGRLLDALTQRAQLEDVDNLAYAFVRGRYSVAVASIVGRHPDRRPAFGSGAQAPRSHSEQANRTVRCDGRL